MGLGLPIVRRILDEYGGSVEFVQPVPRFSTTLVVRIPERLTFAMPHILVVDDQPDLAESSLKAVVSPDDAVITVRHPNAVSLDDLSKCAVMAVDHYLDDWAERDSQIPAMSPRDGFRLFAAVLRSQVPIATPGPGSHHIDLAI